MKKYSNVKVWCEKIEIPTYKVGAPDKNPMFLEKRVYQGSSGTVYPHTVIDKIYDEKENKEYNAVFIENDFIKVMVLPELGGRIQRAVDKTNDYDFVYYNHVIKPALVGLAGPWISGGIEFNWPQHHRPSTFDKVNYDIVQNNDGSASIIVGEIENMFRTECVTRFTLYPNSTYIEINAQLYNRTNVAQTFLWWANPAVAVNDNTRTIFPPDVTAVMDHGKRDSATFPIATGTYYKVDYSEGVDISRYKNLPVPTSYMAAASDFDFVGGYDDEKRAGILHIADHHIAPGKKQWTWGCGDFGKAWDRNLTDFDGPYVELMTGCFTDNQPDFSFIAPMEERQFTQYFMPYQKLGTVHNATKDLALHIENDIAALYATGDVGKIDVYICFDNKKEKHQMELKPCDYKELDAKDAIGLEVYKEGKVYLTFCLDFKPQEILEIAKTPPLPKDCNSNEELYIYGTHIEQYRHATYNADDYYIEGLKRDEDDIRINNAYGLRLFKRGLYKESENHFKKAIKRLTLCNPNPYDSEPYYNLGLSLFYQNEFDKAYDTFYKSVWCSKCQESAFYYMAVICSNKCQYDLAINHIEKALIKNAHNYKALCLKGYLLYKLGNAEKSKDILLDLLILNPLCCQAKILLSYKYEINDNTAIEMAIDFASWGNKELAFEVLKNQHSSYPLLHFYMAYYSKKFAIDEINIADGLENNGAFPNRLEDIDVLSFAIDNGSKMADYYLGCLFYNKKRYDDAISHFEMSVKKSPEFATSYRNLSLLYYNKKGDKKLAIANMEKAFSLNADDMRVLLELDLLYKITAVKPEKRLSYLEKYRDSLEKRDDLYLEYITLNNLCKAYQKAYDLIGTHNFHPWEGGEGKVPSQYIYSLLSLAFDDIQRGDLDNAKSLINQTFEYPNNLGEGKLYGAQENLQNYLLGIIALKENSTNAKAYFEKASIGLSTPKSAIYYNDQPPETIFCQGMALKKLGDINGANERFENLIKYCDNHFDDEMKIDYFAVSLPDFLVFETDLNLQNKVHCLFMKALGNLGLDNINDAKYALENAQKLNPSHIGISLYKHLFFN